ERRHSQRGHACAAKSTAADTSASGNDRKRVTSDKECTSRSRRPQLKNTNEVALPPIADMCSDRLWAISGHDAIYSIISVAQASGEGGSLRPSALPLEIESNWFSQR